MADTPVSAFISYSRTDSAFIDRLEADLRAYGFDTWVDRQHLEGGADWARQIEQQIVRCEALVVALSPDAITSTWVRREITFALNAGKHIIPIIARQVERVPIEIIEKQYIDLSSDYTSGLQDLRVALLKVHTLPPPPRPARAPQPLLTLPDVSDPLKGLVQIPAPPPAPNPDLMPLFMQAQSALAHGNLDLAEALLSQIVEQEADFGNGLAAEELQRVRKQLEPVQIERLRKMADDAHASGAWGQEIGALRALATRLPDDKSISDRLLLAEECQKWAWLYDNARGFAQAGDVASTSLALTRLWEKVPYFGDPARISPSGLMPPNASQAGVRRYSSLEQGHVFAKMAAHTKGISALRWAPDGRRIVSASADKVANVIDAHSGESIHMFDSHTDVVNDVAWSHDSRHIASASGDGTIRVWRMGDGTTLFTFYLSNTSARARAHAVDWAPYGLGILAGGTQVVNVQNGREYTKTVRVGWNTSTGSQEWRDEYQTPGTSYPVDSTSVICTSPDGKWFVLSGSTGTLIRTTKAPKSDVKKVGDASIRAVAWAPDNGSIAIETGQRAFIVRRPQRVWTDGLSFIDVFACGGHAGQVHALGWSPDGSRIASASDDGVRLWDATDGRLLFAYGGHDAPVTALDWSPDSTRIASGDDSGALHIWKA